MQQLHFAAMRLYKETVGTTCGHSPIPQPFRRVTRSLIVEQLDKLRPLMLSIQEAFEQVKRHQSSSSLYLSFLP